MKRKKNLSELKITSKFYFLFIDVTRGTLQPELTEGDMLFQQTSTIARVRWPNSASKSRSGSSKYTTREIATANTAKELQSSQSQGISEEVHWESAIILQ